MNDEDERIKKANDGSALKKKKKLKQMQNN